MRMTGQGLRLQGSGFRVMLTAGIGDRSKIWPFGSGTAHNFSAKHSSDLTLKPKA